MTKAQQMYIFTIEWQIPPFGGNCHPNIFSLKMNTTLFQNLGLSLNEAQIYDALITYGGSSVSTISLRSKVHRRNAYDVLQRLVEKGLAYEVFGQKETIYEPVDPEKLMEFVKEKEMELEKAMPKLLKTYQSKKSVQRAYMYKGIEGVKNYLRMALKSGEDVYSLGAKGAWFDERLKTFNEWFIKEGKKKKIKYFHIFDHEVKKELSWLPKAVGKPYKFLPKDFSTNSCFDIFGDHVVTFTGLNLGRLDDDVTIFVMTSPELAEGYRTWWKMVWELLPK